MASSSTNKIYLAAVEGGGTTFVASVARVVPLDEAGGVGSDGDKATTLRIGPTTLQILHAATIPPKNADTGEISQMTPVQILEETCAFLESHLPSCGRYSAVGIATFGPAGVDPARKDHYGTILPGSPKREWRGIDLLTPIAEACGLSDDIDSVGFDTDVNAPALAEFRHRCHLQEGRQYQQQQQRRSQSSANEEKRPLTSLSYITIGTGVGVGLVLNSRPVHGLLHPEGGHVAIRPLEGDDLSGYSWGAERSPYGGVGTVEGVASSVALTERLLRMEGKGDADASDATTDGHDASDAQAREALAALPDAHPLWDHASNAIANLCVSLLLLTSCQKIVLGGGVMKRRMLYDMVRRRTRELLNGYLDSVDELSSEEGLGDVIVGGSWEREGVGSGVSGAFALALDAYEGGRGVEEEGGDEMNGAVKSVERRRKNDDEVDERGKSFTSGVLAGIGLSFGCVLLSSLLGHGRSRR